MSTTTTGPQVIPTDEEVDYWVAQKRAKLASGEKVTFFEGLVIIVLASGLLGTAILFEASLSFLGLGVPPPNPSGGADVSAARSYFPIHIWVALFPGAAISLAVLGVVLMGDMLRDVLDPRLRNR